jgi:hypothetical protein
MCFEQDNFGLSYINCESSFNIVLTELDNYNISKKSSSKDIRNLIIHFCIIELLKLSSKKFKNKPVFYVCKSFFYLL